MTGFARGLALVAAAAIALSVTALGQARFERGGRALDVAPLTVTLSPASAVNPIGTPHTVTATVTNQGNPVAGATVVFRVTGANSATGSGTTDANGIALFTYTGVQTGQDTIGAQATLVDNGTVVGEGSSDPVTKTWITGISVSK